MRIPILLVVAAGCAHVDAQSSGGGSPLTSNPDAREVEARARSNAEKQVRGEWAAVYEDFDEGMRKALSVEKLQQIAKSHEEQWGRLLGVIGVRGQKRIKSGSVALVNLQYQTDVHTTSFFFDDQLLISGSWDNPATAASIMFLEALGAHHWDLADQIDNQEMRTVAPPSKLATIWADLEAKFGAFESVGRSQGHGLYAVTDVSFGHTLATFNVGVDKFGRITGFHVIAVGESPLQKEAPPPPNQPQLEFDRQSGSLDPPAASEALTAR